MSDLEQRIENWARWCRSNPNRAHCFSIEHRYKAPPCWESQEPHIEIDTLDAVIVEKAVIGLPVKYMMALKYARVMPWVDYWVQVRKIGCKSRDYGDTVRRAQIMLGNVLKGAIK